MHINDIQMRLCIVKLGIVSSIYGDFMVESDRRCTEISLLLIGIYKAIFTQVLA